MAFVPRTTSPTRDNIYYKAPNPFEWNWDISMWNGGNCTAYAWGRFHEILGNVKDPDGYWLPTYNAEDWYYNVRGYERGSKPKLGSVLCLAGGWGAGCGHVAIVEAINPDGSIVVSESGYRSFIWHNKTIYPPYDYNFGYKFQGFIYNPGVSSSGRFVDAPEVFLTEARKHIGPQGHAWVKSMTSIGNGAWCAATICAIAKAVGFGGKCLPPDSWEYYYVSRIARYVVDKGGLYIKGPRKGNNVKPQPGDLILYDWDQVYTDTYDSDHIGVVEKIEGDNITTIEGNASDTYKRRVFKYTWKCINYYVRPNWSMVGGSFVTSGMYQPIYTTRSTSADASIRDVGYVSNNGSFTASKTDTGLSVINYTKALGTLSEMIGDKLGLSSSSGNVDTSGITNTVARGIADYMLNKGLNRAATAGILGNIQAESGFRVDAKEYGYPYEGRGICQWSFGRREKLIARVPDWEHNLQGQLDFLWDELSTSYNSSVLQPLKSVPDTEDGCYSATKQFVMKFEVPAGYNTKAVWDRRYSLSLPFFKAMKIVSNPVIAANNTVTTAAQSKSSKVNTTTGSISSIISNISGSLKDDVMEKIGVNISTNGGKDSSVPNTKLTVSVPSSIRQTGVISDYAHYTGKFKAADVQRVYNAWVSNSRTQNYSIATLRGYYILSLPAKFGNIQDIVKITLQDGRTINGIIGMITDLSNTGLTWGRLYNQSISIVRFMCPEDNQKKLTSGLKSIGWYGKRIIQVVNYGRYQI